MYRLLVLLILLPACAVEKQHKSHLKKIGNEDVSVTDFLVSPGDKCVFSAINNKIYVIGIENSKTIDSIIYPENTVIQCIALSSDSTYLIAGTRSGEIYIQNLRLNTIEPIKLSDSQISALALNSSNTMIACGTLDGSVFVLDINGNVLNRQNYHEDLVSKLKFDNTDQILASSGLDGNVYLNYINEEYRISCIFDKESPCRGFSFNNKGDTLLAGYDNGRIYMLKFDSFTWDLTEQIAHLNGWITDISFTSIEKGFSISSTNGTVIIFLTVGYVYKYKFNNSVRQLHLIVNPNKQLSVIVSLEGKGLYLLSAKNMHLKLNTFSLSDVR